MTNLVEARFWGAAQERKSHRAGTGPGPPVATGEQVRDGRGAGQSGWHHVQSGLGIPEHGLSRRADD